MCPLPWKVSDIFGGTGGICAGLVVLVVEAACNTRNSAHVCTRRRGKMVTFAVFHIMLLFSNFATYRYVFFPIDNTIDNTMTVFPNR